MQAQLELSPVEVRMDPPDRPCRLAMIALASDLTSERDAQRVIPKDRAVLHVARVANANPTTPENLRKMGPRLADTAALLAPGIDLQGVYYSCTAASVTIGDEAVVEAIHQARPGLPVVTPSDAAVQAFAALSVRKIALLTPYLIETTQPIVEYFRGRGLDIVSAHCLGFADDREMARISADSIESAAVAVDRSDAEALFISCTALPALGVIDRLEARLGKPVVTSNQAGFWRLLHHGGVSPAEGAPGHLFSLTPKETAP